MKLHPRFYQVNKAELELSTIVAQWQNKYDLTYLEAIGALLQEALSLKKYALRSERHPDDPNREGDRE